MTCSQGSVADLTGDLQSTTKKAGELQERLRAVQEQLAAEKQHGAATQKQLAEARQQSSDLRAKLTATEEARQAVVTQAQTQDRSITKLRAQLEDEQASGWYDVLFKMLGILATLADV